MVTGIKRTELESLLTVRTIRQLATKHLQTLLDAAQVDSSQTRLNYIKSHKTCAHKYLAGILTETRTLPPPHETAE